ncbi:MAG: 5'/3'-nucleotidase SurE [Firmicutes bacterium]|nr:5'/3'-nucleotidase SurE [Bacillota bacterium]
MRILLSNDDGVHAEGILSLAQAMSEIPGAELYVAAPDRERSASGHAITVYRPLHVDEVELPGVTGVVWRISGTPADCVKLALDSLMPARPDLVISGINRGANLGTDVFYSGTVSAAIEATFSDVPAIAISLADWKNPDYSAAAAFMRFLAPKVLERGLPPRSLLNVNVPAVERKHLAGVAMTKLGVRLYTNQFDRRVDPRGRVYYWLTGDLAELHNDPDSDVYAVQQNLISVTPIQLDLTHHAFIPEVEGWGLGAFVTGGKR